MAANFEKNLISPGFPLNLGKVTECQRIRSKALAKTFAGVPKDRPGLNRVKNMTSGKQGKCNFPLEIEIFKTKLVY